MLTANSFAFWPHSMFWPYFSHHSVLIYHLIYLKKSFTLKIPFECVLLSFDVKSYIFVLNTISLSVKLEQKIISCLLVNCNTVTRLSALFPHKQWLFFTGKCVNRPWTGLQILPEIKIFWWSCVPVLKILCAQFSVFSRTRRREKAVETLALGFVFPKLCPLCLSNNEIYYIQMSFNWTAFKMAALRRTQVKFFPLGIAPYFPRSAVCHYPWFPCSSNRFTVLLLYVFWSVRWTCEVDWTGKRKASSVLFW